MRLGRVSSCARWYDPAGRRAGFRPEFGARELRRLIRSEVETQLARAMLANEVHEGDRVVARWDAEAGKVVLEPQPDDTPAAEISDDRKDANRDRHSAEAAE
nr:hypothetical protein [Rubellimicrobium arenae]